LDGGDCWATGAWAGAALGVDGCDAGAGTTGPTPRRDDAHASVNSVRANAEALRIILPRLILPLTRIAAGAAILT